MNNGWREQVRRGPSTVSDGDRAGDLRVGGRYLHGLFWLAKGGAAKRVRQSAWEWTCAASAATGANFLLRRRTECPRQLLKISAVFVSIPQRPSPANHRNVSNSCTRDVGQRRSGDAAQGLVPHRGVSARPQIARPVSPGRFVTSVDVADAPNTAAQTQLGVADRSLLTSLLPVRISLGELHEAAAETAARGVNAKRRESTLPAFSYFP
jgi:hypothetical protein